MGAAARIQARKVPAIMERFPDLVSLAPCVQKKQRYTDAQRARAVDLLRTSGLTPAEVACELKMPEATVRQWVYKAGIRLGKPRTAEARVKARAGVRAKVISGVDRMRKEAMTRFFSGQSVYQIAREVNVAQATIRFWAREEAEKTWSKK